MNLYKMSFFLLSISLLVFFCYVSCSDPASPDNKFPKITLKGKNPDTLSLNTPYVDPGAQAIDPEEGDISSKITVTGAVDFTKPGNCILTYQVADSKGLSITATRTVVVINSTQIKTGLEDTIKASSLSDTSFSNVTTTYRIISSRLQIGGNVIFGRKTRFITNGQIEIIANGTLTIQEGVTVLFSENSNVSVTTGTLRIMGSDSLVVTLGPASDKYWGASGGILLSSTSTGISSIDYCTIDSAVIGSKIVKDGLSITNSVFKNCKTNGVVFGEDAGPKDSLSFIGNSFINCGTTINDYPLSINVSKITRLPGNSIFSANKNQLIGVNGLQINEPGIWRKHSVPYAFSSSASMNNDAVSIQIQAGVKMLFAQSASLKIVKGTFIAEGSPTDSIEFKNLENGKFWGSTAAGSYGIDFESTVNANCKLAYCIIDSAMSAVMVKKDKLVFSNNSIKHSEHYGMCFDQYSGPKDSASFMDNSFVQNGTTNADYPLVIYDDFIIRLSGTGLFSGNSCQAIKTIGSCAISESGVWRKHAVPYDMYNYIACNNRIFSQSGVTITVQPGCKLRFSAENSIAVYDQGAFIAVGTASDTIVMENLINGTTWGGINYESDCATTSSVKYCRISGAKTGVKLNASPIPVSNSSITRCDLGIHMVKTGSSAVDTTSILFVANGSNTKYND
ncbi:MAG TPA: DUF5011 domain-containing protein [Chitinispirillaceae bacterium]|nr:DUF5011 domain-containing protein [Chitinispirillaceae bacterium]